MLNLVEFYTLYVSNVSLLACVFEVLTCLRLCECL